MRASAGDKLPADLVFSAGFPLSEAWRDADQAQGSVYLPTFRDIASLAVPEYVAPAGINYDPCFLAGNCPESLWMLGFYPGS